MNIRGATCPYCGSSRTASRRQLFHCLMQEQPLSRAFSWYSERTAGACPPKSLFFILLVMLALLGLPAAGLWARELHATLSLLGYALAVLLLCLAADLLVTFRRYRSWGSQWLCGDCRATFRRAGATAGNPRLY